MTDFSKIKTRRLCLTVASNKPFEPKGLAPGDLLTRVQLNAESGEMVSLRPQHNGPNYELQVHDVSGCTQYEVIVGKEEFVEFCIAAVKMLEVLEQTSEKEGR